VPARNLPDQGETEAGALRPASAWNPVKGREQPLALLLANASHELRTPLARIRLGLELVAAHPECGNVLV
jgi:signal transduction histidine kinase